MISKVLEIADPAITGAAGWLSGWGMDQYNRTGSFNYTRTIATHIGAAFIALGLAGYATNPGFIVFPFFLGAIWLGVMLSPWSRPSGIMLGMVAVICLSALIAIPFAAHLPATLLLAALTVVLLPLLFVRNPYIFIWFMPVWIIHAGICFWQWFVLDMPRVSGITGNANSAAALLLIGCIYLLNGRNRVKWVMLPLLVAIIYTGSRWTVGVSGITLLVLFLSRHINWRYIAVGIVVSVAVAVAVDWQDMKASWLRVSTLEEHLTGQGITSTATEIAHIRFWPQGFSNNGIHSVPWRMMHETGLLSGIAWLVASVYGLFRYWRERDARWWMFLSVVLISLLYYHAWLGPLAGFWWLLVRPTRTLSQPAPDTAA